jgi:hypothetical protein
MLFIVLLFGFGGLKLSLFLNEGQLSGAGAWTLVCVL